VIVGVQALELDAHSDAAIAPRDAPIRFDVVRMSGQPELGCTVASTATGLIVRIARPPLPMLSVSAEATTGPAR
jgi:hypothetical protein